MASDGFGWLRIASGRNGLPLTTVAVASLRAQVLSLLGLSQPATLSFGIYIIIVFAYVDQKDPSSIYYKDPALNPPQVREDAAPPTASHDLS